MKILWVSDSPTSPSGFGNTTRFVCSSLARLGHQVSILGTERRGDPRRLRNYTVYPFALDGSEAEALLGYLRQLRPDVLVTVADVWRVGYIATPTIARFMQRRKIIWALYYPIDSDKGKNGLPQSLVQILKTVDIPIAMSRYGCAVSEANGVTPAYIPTGVDTRVFSRPENKAAAKRALGYDNRFVILSDARNQIRKLWPRTLEIFRRFAEGKDEVLLHLHCDPFDPAAQTADYCYDLLADIEFLGLSHKVRFTRNMSIRRGIALSKLGALYQAADVHLLASYGEGFGMPTLQAAAAGVVPMAAAYSANRELVRGHGEGIRVRYFARDRSNLRCALIDIDHAVDRLERLYKDRALLESKSKAARRFAEAYDWAHIGPQWHDLLEREVPRLRSTCSRRKTAARSVSSIGTRRIKGPKPSDRSQRKDHTRPTNEFRTRIKALENKVEPPSADKVASSVSGNQFSIPVTLPPIDSALVQMRVTGRVYLASAADLMPYQQLRTIFPALSAWSTTGLDSPSNGLNAGDFEATIVSASSPEFQAFLAASTLALDFGAVQPALPRRAAELGVPLVSLASHSDQQWLWPDLALQTPNVRTAIEKARWMLTDHCDANAVCALARKRAGRRARQRHN